MVSKIKPSIVLTNKTQHSTRISGGNHIRRDIFSDHASRAYDTILAFVYSWVYDSGTPNPDTVLNGDRESIHFYCRPKLWINGMSGSTDRNIWTNHYIVANDNFRIVNNSKTHIWVKLSPIKILEP